MQAMTRSVGFGTNLVSLIYIVLNINILPFILTLVQTVKCLKLNFLSQTCASDFLARMLEEVKFLRAG